MRLLKRKRWLEGADERRRTQLGLPPSLSVLSLSFSISLLSLSLNSIKLYWQGQIHFSISKAAVFVGVGLEWGDSVRAVFGGKCNGKPAIRLQSENRVPPLT